MESQLARLSISERNTIKNGHKFNNKENDLGHRNPFEFMKICDNSFLNDIRGRSPCTKCKKSRKFFCYTCYLPTEEIAPLLPKVKLPLKIDIIKHKKEIDGKSTAIHAAILASNDVSIYTYPNIPNYENDPEGTTVLIFPSHNSIHVDGIFDAHRRLQNSDELPLPKGYNKGTLLKFRLNEIVADDENRSVASENKNCISYYNFSNLPIKRAVFIDSTWNQSKGIYKDPRINQLRSVVLQNRLSQFWRHQKNSPRWYLSTVEAIHQFLIEVHANAWSLSQSYQALNSLEVQSDFIRKHLNMDENINSEKDGPSDPYNGQYDNLFFFFTHMYQLIHKYYDHNILKAYKRPIQ